VINLDKGIDYRSLKSKHSEIITYFIQQSQDDEMDENNSSSFNSIYQVSCDDDHFIILISHLNLQFLDSTFVFLFSNIYL